jgi:hypothetical protein
MPDLSSLQVVHFRKAKGFDEAQPGHMIENAPLDAGAISYTRDYLLAFEEEVQKAANSNELIAAMTKRYPHAAMSIALQTGAKVAKGEMEWH